MQYSNNIDPNIYFVSRVTVAGVDLFKVSLSFNITSCSRGVDISSTIKILVGIIDFYLTMSISENLARTGSETVFPEILRDFLPRSSKKFNSRLEVV